MFTPQIKEPRGECSAYFLLFHLQTLRLDCEKQREGKREGGREKSREGRWEMEKEVGEERAWSLTATVGNTTSVLKSA